MPKPLAESNRLVEVKGAATDTPNRKNIQIITPGWGSSGYYSAEVLEQAAKDKVIPAGTFMFLNHASESERTDRPERDVEKIAAVLVEDAQWDGTRLFGPADIIGPHAELIDSLAPYIGVSISGSATDITIGEVDGRTGPIVEGLAKVDSVDFVTHAGRGGTVLLESARPSLVNALAVKHGIAEATVNDTREALSNLLRDTYGADKTYVWVRDFDDTTVWFEIESDTDAGIFGQSYTQDAAGAVALTGERTEVRVVTNYVPVNPAGPTTEESKEDTMPQIEEARLRELEEAHGRVPTLESERDTAVTERDEARSERDQLRARESATTAARTRVTEANANLAPAVVDRIVAEATRTIPMTDAGALDEAALNTAVDAARKAEETYLATLVESAGGGKLIGFGESAAITESGDKHPTTNAWGRPLAVKGA